MLAMPHASSVLGYFERLQTSELVTFRGILLEIDATGVTSDDATLADVISQAWTRLRLKSEGWFILRLRQDGDHEIQFPERSRATRMHAKQKGNLTSEQFAELERNPA